MEEFDINNFDFNNIPEDENSKEINRTIAELKAQGLTNNIDFEKALEEEAEIQAKKERDKERDFSHSHFENNTKDELTL